LTMYMSSYADKRYLLSYGICSGYGLAAAAEQEGARKSTKYGAAPNEKSGRPKATASKPHHYHHHHVRLRRRASSAPLMQR
jgi:hypothetical protein